jgi:hypothetical protein
MNLKKITLKIDEKNKKKNPKKLYKMKILQVDNLYPYIVQIFIA